MKNSKEFHRYIGQKWQSMEWVPPLINKKGELATANMEKTEVLNKFFALVFTGSLGIDFDLITLICINMFFTVIIDVSV